MTLDNNVTNYLNNNNTLNNVISNNNLLGTFKDCVLKAEENADCSLRTTEPSLKTVSHGFIRTVRSWLFLKMQSLRRRWNVWKIRLL